MCLDVTLEPSTGLLPSLRASLELWSRGWLRDHLLTAPPTWALCLDAFPSPWAFLCPAHPWTLPPPPPNSPIISPLQTEEPVSKLLGGAHLCRPISWVSSYPEEWNRGSFYKFHESESCSVMSESLRPHGLCSPWNSLGQNTGVGSLSLLQRIFPIQGSNPALPHCRQTLYQLSHIISYKFLLDPMCPCSPISSHFRGLFSRHLGLPWWLRWWRIHLQCRRPGFSPWDGKIPWRREWQPTPVFLPGESHGLKIQFMGLQRCRPTEQLTLSLFFTLTRIYHLKGRFCSLQQAHEAAVLTVLCQYSLASFSQ